MLIELNGVNHHYVSYGHGPPVVFVHGLGGDLHLWWAVMQTLSVNHHVVAMDLRGHGLTSGGRANVTMKTYMQDVEALIDALELPAVTLVGHSMGTLVAQMVAGDRPEAVDQLVLVGGISSFEPPQKQAYQDRADTVEADGMDALVDPWLEAALSPRTHGRIPQVAGLLRDAFLRNDPKQYARACRALAKAPSIDRGQLGQPTLLIVGDHDRSTPMAMTERLHREIPVSRVKVIHGAAHWAPLEEPDQISTALLEFLT